ncbi:MAG: MMPL family transporter, partial [Actinobacteria bacterium]|nr:MMPL family transporter [Actinomycetota bacterium]
KLSVANRSVVALVTVITAIFGFISLGSLKQELIPSFEFPQAAIVTSYPGASPEVVDAQVSQVIEDAVRQIDGLANSSSTSQSNLSLVRVEFEFGTTSAQVTEDVAAAIARIKSNLPADVEPNIISGSFDSVPIIALGVSANNGDNETIAQALADVAGPLFAQVPGVRDVNISGTIEKRINLELKTAVLAANGLSQQSIVSALQANGFVLPAGSIDDDKGSISIEVGSAVTTLEDFKKLPLIGARTVSALPTAQTPAFPTRPTAGATPTNPGAPGAVSANQVLTVEEVATVTYENAPVTSIARTNGKPALSVSIIKTQDGNTVAVSNGVEEKIAELKEKLGDVTVVTIFDQAPFVEKSLENLTVEGLLGLGFAILIILVFLLSIRSTIVTAISIPTSVLVTFIGLNQFGFSLNILTLSALTIAIGRVVDDSIVVIENINRHLSYGEPKKDAILNAVKEVSGAITAATITTVAVFLPIALVTGLIGEIFRPFAFTFTIALVASLFVSLTIVPVLAYWFLKSPAEKAMEQGQSLEVFAAEARQAEEAKERKSWLQRGYLPILTWTQKRPVITVTASFLVLVFTFGLVPFLKTDFIGSSGNNGFTINQTLPAGSTFEQRDKAASSVESLLLANKEVKVVQTTIGLAADGRVAFGASAGGTAIQVTLIEDADVAAVQADLEAKFAANSALGEVKINSGGGPGFGSSSTIDIKVLAPTEEKLLAAISSVENAMRGTPDVSEITNSLAKKQRTLQVTVDRVAAAEKGLTEIAVSGIVASQLRPSSIGKLNIENTETPIYVLQSDVPDTVEKVKAISIPTATGLVALSSIAKIEEVEVPVSITSEKGDRTAQVSLTPSGDNLGAISAEVTERLGKVSLPLGTTATIGGISSDQAESFSQLGLALLAAIAIVFIVMVATFSSLIQPLILLISIPFAATGALGLLLLSDTPLGVPALIGMLLLVGVVVTNAIVLIDLINQYRKQGRPLQEAIMDGARQRLRPILMTALATIFALTPMALGFTGGGGFISQPLAVVVVGGLFSSTILTLVIVPVLYWLVEGRKERRMNKSRGKAPRMRKSSRRAARKAAAKLG